MSFPFLFLISPCSFLVFARIFHSPLSTPLHSIPLSPLHSTPRIVQNANMHQMMAVEALREQAQACLSTDVARRSLEQHSFVAGLMSQVMCSRARGGHCGGIG